MAYFDKYVTTEDSFPGFDRVWTVSVETTTATWAALAFFAISVGAMAIPHVVPIPAVFTAPIVVLSLSFVPGTLFLLTLKRKHVTVGAEHLLYAFGSSLIVLMFVGTVSNVLLPYVGVTRPLMRSRSPPASRQPSVSSQSPLTGGARMSRLLSRSPRCGPRYHSRCSRFPSSVYWA